MCPDNSEVFTELVRFYLKGGNKEIPLQLISEWKSKYPLTTHLQQIEGDLIYEQIFDDIQMGKNLIALEKLKMITSGDYVNIEALKTYSGLLVSNRQFEEAIEKLNVILKNEPENFEALINRGISRAYLKRFHLAVVDFSRANFLDPEHTVPMYYLGMCHLGLGHRNEGLEWLRMASREGNLDATNILEKNGWNKY